MKKRNLVLGSVVVLAALLVVGGTMAWFTAESDPVENKFTAGKVEIELHDDFPEDGISNVNPGDEHSKVVYVENTGTIPIYVRVELTPEWKDAEGQDLGLTVSGADMATFPILEGWELHEGWYYYTSPVAAGASTSNLIEEVIFAGAAMTNDYQGATFTLKVEAEAIQATNGAADGEWGINPESLAPTAP